MVLIFTNLCSFVKFVLKFCPKCGSRITGGENPERGIIGLTASSLDDGHR